MRNANGFYAAIKILNIKDDTRDDKFDEVTFDYTIQTNGSPDFTSNRNWFKGLTSQSTSKEEVQDSIRDYVATQSPSKVYFSIVQPTVTISDATATTIKQPRHCDTQANYDRAEPFFKRALAIDEEVLGSGQPEIANSLNNLATLYQAQGNYDQAETLFKRALAIAEKALGPDHPSVAASLNNLAILYQAQGNYAQAEPLFMRALEIAEKTLDPDHLTVATCLNNLAGLYHAQGNYAQAEPFFKRALEIAEKALDPIILLSLLV